MPGPYQDELDAIRNIRNRHPDIPARTLARRITRSDYTLDDPANTRNWTDVKYAAQATFCTTYSRIRRYDTQH